MLQLFCALALIVALMFGYLGLVQLVVNPSSVLWATRRRLRLSAQVRRECNDLDREHKHLLDEHRHTP